MAGARYNLRTFRAAEKIRKAHHPLIIGSLLCPRNEKRNGRPKEIGISIWKSILEVL